MAEILYDNYEDGEDNFFIDSNQDLPLTLPLAIMMKSNLLAEKNKDPILSKKHMFRQDQLR